MRARLEDFKRPDKVQTITRGVSEAHAKQRHTHSQPLEQRRRPRHRCFTERGLENHAGTMRMRRHLARWSRRWPTLGDDSGRPHLDALRNCTNSRSMDLRTWDGLDGRPLECRSSSRNHSPIARTLAPRSSRLKSICEPARLSLTIYRDDSS